MKNKRRHRVRKVKVSTEFQRMHAAVKEMNSMMKEYVYDRFLKNADVWAALKNPSLIMKIGEPIVFNSPAHENIISDKE